MDRDDLTVLKVPQLTREIGEPSFARSRARNEIFAAAFENLSAEAGSDFSPPLA